MYMMRKLAIAMVATGAMGSTGMANALGLGEITMHSALNQPLHAEVELLSVKNLDAWEIKPTLANGADFDKAGVERFYFLTDLSFDVQINDDGKAFVTIKSKKPVIEPFVNFLVEVNWPSGRLLREYTLLLDPPVFDEEAPSLLQSDETDNVTYAEETEAAPSVVTKAEVVGLKAAPGTYVVGESDTLWEVAMRVRPSKQVSPQQTMLALQTLNPKAFVHGNINLLKQHQVLRIPTLEDIQKKNKSESITEVAKQNKDFANKQFSKPVASAQIDARKQGADQPAVAETATTGELKLLASSEKEGTASGELGDDRDELENELAITLEQLDENSRENDDLRNRMGSLEEQLQTLQRLIALKDDQLAAMQAGASAEEVASIAATEETPVEEVVSEITEDALTEENAETNAEDVVVDELASEEVLAEGASDELVADESESEFAEDGAAVEGNEVVESQEQDLNFQQEAVAEPVVDAPVEPVAPAPQGIMQIAQQYLWQIAAGLAALILALLAIALRKRKENNDESEFDDAQSFDESENYDEHEHFDEFEEGYDELPDELSSEDSVDMGDFDLDVDMDSTADLAFDEEIVDLAEDEQVVAQTSDALSEADIYIAYGRFDQASELLTNALLSEPARTDLRLKLMEVLVETNDAAAFVEHESQLVNLTDEEKLQAESLKSRISIPTAAAAVDEVSLDELTLDDEITLDDELTLDDEITLDDELTLDDEITLDDELTLDDEITLDDELTLDDEIVLDGGIEELTLSEESDSMMELEEVPELDDALLLDD
jgi:pilus assembly protein FimV